MSQNETTNRRFGANGGRQQLAVNVSSDSSEPLTLTDMMVSPVDQLPQYRPANAPTNASPTTSTSSGREIKDPVYAPFLPADMTSTTSSTSFSSPSDLGHVTANSPGPSRARMPSLMINTDDSPSPVYSLSPPSATADGGISLAGSLSPFTEEQIADWKRGGPYVEASANVDDNGQIDVSIEVMGTDKPLPPLPMRPTESSSVSASAPASSLDVHSASTSSRTEMESLASASASPNGDKKSRKGKGKAKEEKAWYEDSVPVMNIVIFIVGSRGEPYLGLANGR